MLIKPGETIQFYIDMNGVSGIGDVRLEYTTTGGVVWVTDDYQGEATRYVGTAESPLTDVVKHGFIKNESPKDRVYRWRCTSYTSGPIPCYMNRHDPLTGKFQLGNAVYILWDDEAPLSGVDGDGAGFAGKASLFLHTAHPGLIYRNDGNATMPNWVSL